MSSLDESSLSSCPSEDEFVALLDGTIESSRLQRMEEHLAACRACAETLGELAKVWVHSSAPEEEKNVPEHDGFQSVDSVVGRYQVNALLGHGGMGVVYKAYDPELQRHVALKILRPDLYIPQQKEEHEARLLREARLLAALHHPNIPTIFEVGTWNHQTFLAIQYVDGKDLRRWLQTNRPSWREIVEIYLRVGSGIVAAHQAGVIHRDIKPDNILIENNGEVFVTDFGLARTQRVKPVELSNEPQSLNDTLTVKGGILGTLAYMSPEQIDGFQATVLSDQFSFCLSLYESLYGVRPFVGHSLDSVRASMQSGAIARPSNSSIPSKLFQAIAKGLETLPVDRHASMETLLNELEVIVRKGRRVSSSPNSPHKRLQRSVLFLSSLFVLILVAVVALFFSGKLIFLSSSSSIYETLREQTLRLDAKQRKKRKEPRTRQRSRPSGRVVPTRSRSFPKRVIPRKRKRVQRPEARSKVVRAAPRTMTRLPKRRRFARPRTKPRPKPKRRFPRKSNLQRVMMHFQKAARLSLLRKGKGCLQQLELASRWKPNRHLAQALLFRKSICLMLAGQCGEGSSTLRRYHQGKGTFQSEKALNQNIHAMRTMYCSHRVGSLLVQSRRLRYQVQRALLQGSITKCRRYIRHGLRLSRRMLRMHGKVSYKAYAALNSFFDEASACVYKFARPSSRCKKVEHLWFQQTKLRRYVKNTRSPVSFAWAQLTFSRKFPGCSLRNWAVLERSPKSESKLAR